MPTSKLELAPVVLAYIWEVRPPDRPIRVVDVGPGWGKYATLIREYVDPEAEVAGIEAWEPYVDEHDLDCLYGEHGLLTCDALEALPGHDTEEAWMVRQLLTRADVVLMIDVLEHMPKPEALNLLTLIPGHVVFCTPVDYFENPDDLPPTERHVSHWTLADFAGTDRLHGYDVNAYEVHRAIVGRLNAWI